MKVSLREVFLVFSFCFAGFFLVLFPVVLDFPATNSWDCRVGSYMVDAFAVVKLTTSEH